MSSTYADRKDSPASEPLDAGDPRESNADGCDGVSGGVRYRTGRREKRIRRQETCETGQGPCPVPEDGQEGQRGIFEVLPRPAGREGRGGPGTRQRPVWPLPQRGPGTGDRRQGIPPGAAEAGDAAEASSAREAGILPEGAVRRGAVANLVHNRWAAAAGAFLIFMYGVALLAGFIAPYGMNQTHYKAPADYAYHPPMIPRLRDEQGRFQWPPFVYGTKRTPSEGVGYTDDRTAKYPLRLFVRGAEYELAFGLIESDLHLIGVREPGRLFLLGTDQFGRDLLSRIIYGSRISLSIGLLGIAITFTLGLAIGGASGFFGGLTDSLLMRGSEVVMSLPGLYLIVALAGVLPAGLRSDVRYLLIVAILSLVGWAGLSRVIRGMVLSIRENDYVLAARAIGAKNGRILLRHVIPNTMSYVIVAATLSVPYYILGEVSLSYLGVGIKEPQASWGLMLSDAQSVTALREFTWLLFPGAFIFLVVMSFNILGDGLRDAYDPKGRHTRAF